MESLDHQDCHQVSLPLNHPIYLKVILAIIVLTRVLLSYDFKKKFNMSGYYLVCVCTLLSSYLHLRIVGTYPPNTVKILSQMTTVVKRSVVH